MKSMISRGRSWVCELARPCDIAQRCGVPPGMYRFDHLRAEVRHQTPHESGTNPAFADS
jgi:hypothetical protein